MVNTSSTMTGLRSISEVDVNASIGRGVPDGSQNDVARLRPGSLSCSIERVSGFVD